MLSQTNSFVRTLSVSGVIRYDGRRWWEAIKCFLEGCWAEDPRIFPRAHLVIDGVVSLYRHHDYYQVVLEGEVPSAVVPAYRLENIYHVSSATHETDLGLIMFALNQKRGMLVINFPHDRKLYLWRTKQVGELGLALEGFERPVGESGSSDEDDEYRESADYVD